MLSGHIYNAAKKLEFSKVLASAHLASNFDFDVLQYAFVEVKHNLHQI